MDGSALSGSAEPVATARLLLRPPTAADVAEVFDLYADPQVWASDPVSRQDRVEQTERMVEAWAGAWRRDGLGMWVARSALPDDVGALVGIGGCFVRLGVAWNLGFRLRPACWGFGYAVEIATGALQAARRLRPDLPVTAYLLEGNDRSQRAVERLGLRQVWRGRDAGNPDATAVRLLYADRELAQDVVQALTER